MLEMLVGFLVRVVLVGASITRDGMVSTMYLLIFLAASAASPLLVRELYSIHSLVLVVRAPCASHSVTQCMYSWL